MSVTSWKYLKQIKGTENSNGCFAFYIYVSVRNIKVQSWYQSVHVQLSVTILCFIVQ